MNKSNHTPYTPGPWKLDWHANYVGIKSESISESIAGNYFVFKIADNGRIVPSIEDAKLMTMAPELLALCKKAYSYYMDVTGKLEFPENDIKAIIDKIENK